MELLLRWTIWPIGSCFNDLTSFRSRYNLKYKSPCVCSFIFFLQFSYRSICSSKKFTKALEVLQNVIPLISAAYLEIFNNPQSNREFFGLRDFYRYTQLSSTNTNEKQVHLKSKTSIYILLVFNFYLFTIENVHMRNGESKTRKNSMYLCNV